VVRSPRSRGRGNRRWPGRPGGARKRRRVGQWTRRCQHLVSLDCVPQPHHTGFHCTGSWGQKKNRRPEDFAYLIDQEMARLGIPYWMTLVDGYLCREFFVIVSEAHASQAEAVIARRTQATENGPAGAGCRSPS